MFALLRYHRDEPSFREAYPEVEKGITALKLAIDRARECRGERSKRNSKNGPPDAPARTNNTNESDSDSDT